MNNRQKSNSREIIQSLNRLKLYKKVTDTGDFSYYSGSFNFQRCAIKAFHRQRDFEHEQSIILKLSEITKYQSSQDYFIANLGFITKPLYYAIEEATPPTLYSTIQLGIISNDFLNKRKIMLDIAKGLKLLHSLNITHNDLTPLNIFIVAEQIPHPSNRAKASAKIGNFTKAIDLDKANNPKPQHTSLEYAAPESQESATYSKASDIYSFSINLWSILENRSPFSSIHDPQEMLKLKKSGHPLAFSFRTPVNYQKILRKCWQTDYSKRPNTQSLTTSLFNAEIKTENLHTRSLKPSPWDPKELEPYYLKKK